MEPTTRLTREKRHLVYKKALEYYRESVTGRYGLGMCQALEKACDILAIIPPGEGIYAFPEIMKHKPVTMNPFWFPLNDHDSRVKILESAIEETLPAANYFTMEQRHEIYKRAKEIYLQKVNVGDDSVGMCMPLGNAADIDWERVMAYFPEIARRRPKDAGLYWFPTNDNASRIRIFDDVIRETSPVKENVKKEPFTMEQRNGIYKKTLELYTRMMKRKDSKCGLCGALSTGVDKYFNNGSSYLVKVSYFPEIMKHEPLDHGAYWFPVSDTQKRIDILKDAISRTEPVIGLDKNQRNVIYEEALQLYLEEIARKRRPGMYHVIDMAMNNHGWGKNGLAPGYNLSAWPELEKHLPLTRKSDVYWFDPLDMANRILILQDCINQSR